VGYWGTHAGSENGNPNLTLLTMGAGGGSLSICGETLTNTSFDNGSSALEGLCDSGGGKTQLARQLIAMSLNCISSGNPGPADCIGITPFDETFNTCNALCVSGTNPQINACVDLVSCLNTGGTPSIGGSGNFFCATGKCSDNLANCSAGNLTLCVDPSTATCTPAASTCHDNPTLFPDSPASSPNACEAARKDNCNIFDSSSCTVP
jgi:hypothetical protein